MQTRKEGKNGKSDKLVKKSKVGKEMERGGGKVEIIAICAHTDT